MKTVWKVIKCCSNFFFPKTLLEFTKCCNQDVIKQKGHWRNWGFRVRLGFSCVFWNWTKEWFAEASWGCGIFVLESWLSNNWNHSVCSGIIVFYYQGASFNNPAEAWNHVLSCTTFLMIWQNIFLVTYVSGLELIEQREHWRKHATFHLLMMTTEYHVMSTYENLYDAIRLRTFLPVTRISFWSWYCETLTLELIFKLKCLHVLSFCGCVNLKEVPETMGDLMHLRFLDLSNTGITGQFHHRPQQQCFQLTSYISSFLLPPQTSLQ